jgi:hypothetical protein
MLLVHCPYRSAGFDLIQAWDDEDARKFTALIITLPPKAVRPTFKYLTVCFKPPKQALRWSKLLKLLSDLTPMIIDRQIKRNGTLYTVPLDMWVDRMQQLVESRPETVKLPLKDHAYLLTILANQAEQMAGKAESKTEADKRNGVRPQADANAEPTISMAELKAMAEQKQAETKQPVQPVIKPVTESKPREMSHVVKSSIEEMKAAFTRPERTLLTPEEKEANKQRMLAQAEQLKRQPPEQA